MKKITAEVTEKYGFERAMLMLALRVNSLEWDGRIDKANKEWASKFLADYPNAEAIRKVANSTLGTTHPVLLDSVAEEVRFTFRERNKDNQQVVEGYRIIQTVKTPTAEFLLGQNKNMPSHYVTWYNSDHNGGLSPVWGHYYTSTDSENNRISAYRDLLSRALSDVNEHSAFEEAQHGSASFMTEEQKRQKFKELVLSPITPSVKKLLEEGDRRAIAVDNGQVYIPNVLNLENLFDEAGIVVGKRDFGGKEYIVCLTDDVHTLTIGATGGGKSRREVLQTICMLALAGEGIVVSDPKGELYHYTHTFLESIGYTVHVIDFNQPYKSDRYNPLQRIIDDVNNDDLTNASEHAWDIVNILVEKNEKSEPIWSNGEMAVIVASILAVVYDNRNRPQFQNLTNVYEFISNMSKPAPGEKEIRYTKYLRTLSDSHPANISLSERSLLTPDEIRSFERPYALLISPDPPAVMKSPDISEWLFNRMLGLGSKQHNTDLIMQDEDNRPTFTGKVQIKLWKPWERLEERPPSGIRAAHTVPKARLCQHYA